MTDRNTYNWKFVENLIRNSVDATNLQEALPQWAVVGQVKGNGTDECLCTYKNIVNLNYVKNKISGNIIIVGSCCVKKFGIDLPVEYQIKCCECRKELPITNKYVEALYNNGIVIHNRVPVIGHDKCMKRIHYALDDLKQTIQNQLPRRTYTVGSPTYNMMENFVKYFGGIIRKVEVNDDLELEITLRSEAYEDYLQLLEIIST